MLNRQSIQERRQAVLEVASRHGAESVRVFGSTARGEAREDSDLDLIVHFESGRSLLDHGGLLMDLRELLGMDVDVIDEEAMDARFREHVLKEAFPL